MDDMGNNNNIETLLASLSKLGVCRTGRRYLSGTKMDFDTLVKVWRGWPEFLCEHSEEACRLLREHLTADDRLRLAMENLFFDFRGVVTLEKTVHPVFVAGDSDVHIHIPEFAAVKLYVFNNSTAYVTMHDNAILNAETYDISQLRVYEGWRGKTTCYRYDGTDVMGVERVITKEYVRGDVFNGKEPKKKR